jgi:fatty acid desaturase
VTNAHLKMPCASSTANRSRYENWYRPDIPRQTLKQSMKRSDAPGLKNFGLWISLLLASGAVALYAWGTWWAVPAFFVYGTIYCSSDARWHELARIRFALKVTRC